MRSTINAPVLLRGALAAFALAALLPLAGCRVEKNRSGKDADVRIATPFGGVSVKNNEADVQGVVGLAVYPGATLASRDKDNNGAADVNLNFGSFHLGVKALSYRTPDAPDRVVSFYRRELSRYGAVILCKDHRAVGTPARTGDGLGCEDEGSGVHLDEDGAVGELKAGSKQHQHLVAIDHEGAGTKFGLVALDLPGRLSQRDDEDSKQ